MSILMVIDLLGTKLKVQEHIKHIVKVKILFFLFFLEIVKIPFRNSLER